MNKLVIKSVGITERQDAWLKDRAKALGIREAELLRRILDNIIKEEEE